jgi:hypothetical protein
MTHRAFDSSQSKRIEIYYSPVVYIPATVLFLGASCWLCFWLVAGLFSGHVIAMAVGGVATFFLGPVLLSLSPAVVHPWRHQGPVVILDEDGITDVRKPVSFVPWSDIASIDLGAGETASYLCFEFRQADRKRQDLRSLGPLGTLLNRSRSLSDWNVTLRMLACKKDDLLRSARRLHQQEVRRQVVALNSGHNSGWSGQL